ncbi:Glycosyl hydrolase family 79, N-terminal domain [Frankineae bacterium MT45]|nr:Glycosyl hydrolase family 79, N-terminal domain [Frankineae bacterium MT45]
MAAISKRFAFIAMVGALAATTIGVGSSESGAAAQSGSARVVVLSPGAAQIVATVDDRFLSVAVDMGSVVGASGAPVDFSRTKLVNLTRQLAPAYLRIGGTPADQTYYDLSGSAATPPSGYSYVLTKQEWDATSAFAQASGLDLWLGINDGAGPRDANYHWQGTDAASLLRYSTQRHDPLAIVEFGNEPNLFEWPPISKIPLTYGAAAYARDVQAFDAVRREVAPQTKFAGPAPSFIGSASEDPIDLLGVLRLPTGPHASDIMPRLPGAYDVVAYHYYPAVSSTCGPLTPTLPADVLLPSFLDNIQSATTFMTGLRNRYDPSSPLWIGETGSAACNGQAGYSDRFGESFYYLNELATQARRGVAGVVRQTLVGGNYGLLDPSTLDPAPDYWAALLWKRLMGARQLAIPTAAMPATTRLFASCTPGQPRSVTILALNLGATPATISLAGVDHPGWQAYTVTASNLTSKTVSLNGSPLQPAADGTPPPLSPTTGSTDSITLPSTSYSFIVQPGATPSCS